MTTRPPGPFFLPEFTGSAKLPVIEEQLQISGRVIRLARPDSAETLLDQPAVTEAFAADQYMPYWATLWPVATYMAEVILGRRWPPGCRGIELGCGLGLPGVAALVAGIDLTFSDYDASALRYARENARLNGFTAAKAIALDWRHPPREQFDLIIASDVIYEERSLEPVTAAIETMLAPGGIALVTDQNRPHAEQFRQVLRERGLPFTEQPFRVIGVDGQRLVDGTLYEIRAAGSRAAAR